MRAFPLLILTVTAACGPASLADLRAADQGYAASRLVGPRPDAAACADDLQCQSGLCSATVTSCGVCLTHRFLGESCGGAGQACSASAMCVGGVCVTTKKGLGASCAVEALGGDLGECDDELGCEEESFRKGTCVAALPAGAACRNWRSFCRAGTRCLEGLCTPTTPPAPGAQRVIGMNARCGPGSADGGTLEGECAAGTTCGDPQYPNGPTASDPRPEYRCVPLPLEGESAILHHCAPGLYADSSVNAARPKCSRRLVLGAPCEGDVCAEGLECRHGFCAAVCQ